MSDVYLGGLTTAGGAQPGDFVEIQNPNSTLGLGRPLSYLDWDVNWLFPRNFVENSASVSESVSNNVERAIFADSGSPVAKAVLNIREWGSGTLSYSLYWSGSTGSTSTQVRWVLGVNALTTNSVNLESNSTELTKSQAVALDGPSSPEVLLKNPPWTADTISSSVYLLGLTLTRTAGNAADNYGGDAYVYGFKVTYSS